MTETVLHMLDCNVRLCISVRWYQIVRENSSLQSFTSCLRNQTVNVATVEKHTFNYHFSCAFELMNKLLFVLWAATYKIESPAKVFCSLAVAAYSYVD